MSLLRKIFLFLLLLVIVLVAGLYYFLRGSLAQLDGQRSVGVSAPVELSRDDHGYLTVSAANRLDAARALGFAHAQDRFFQMDLLRRNAAGELSALVGPKALKLDKSRRIHRFRARAEAAFAGLSAEEKALLQAYTDGINKGLAALDARPFEYGLLRQPPKQWQPADSLLAVLSMYLDLQHGEGRDELAMGAIKEAVPADWYAFLMQHSADWDAAVDGSKPTPIPVPASPWPAQLGVAAKLACSDCGLRDSRDIGSNNWAVGGSLTDTGAAIVANDMHLGIRVPHTWYKAQLRWKQDGREVVMTGVTLPGMPAVVVGSNGKVAWGFTNSTCDWTDVIALKLDKTGTKYLSPTGEKPLKIFKERIEVAGGEAVEVEVKETEWGPVLAAPFDRYALRWVAYDKEGLNLRSMGLDGVGSVEEAQKMAVGVGIPAQNFMTADSQGHIGWTIIGSIPRRHYASDADMDTPQDWSTGANGWDGYFVLGDKLPKVYDPADARLWSANQRMVGGTELAMLGTGGYDLGARGQQIRDDLRARKHFKEADLYEIQLDDRALFMQRWKRLLLDEVLTGDFVARNGLADYRRAIETSADRASVDAVGYTWVRAFRDRVQEELLQPISSYLESKSLSQRDLKWAPETPVWALIQARRNDVLPTGNTWKQFFERAVLYSREKVLETTQGNPDNLRWGRQNLSAINHPLASAIPLLGRYLNMPETEFNGDRHMPRVQQPVHGQSERIVVSPGHEQNGIMVLPGGQSGNPISPYYRVDYADWANAKALPFLPGATEHKLTLMP
ncbi:MAG: penicillin acylase family protein [Paucibacter sp.]|nr:penicillin acylase family protein [Roseateles sp.]